MLIRSDSGAQKDSTNVWFLLLACVSPGAPTFCIKFSDCVKGESPAKYERHYMSLRARRKFCRHYGDVTSQIQFRFGSKVNVQRKLASKQ